MTKFLRLPTIIINKSHIKYINFINNKYHIHLSSGSGTFIMGSGTIETEKIVICKKKYADDYAVLEKWVQDLGVATDDSSKNLE